MRKVSFFAAFPTGLCSLCFFLIFGCGYGFGPQGEHFDQRIRLIYVEPFGNRTAQAEVENDLRTAFIDQLTRNSRFKTVASAEEADALIGGNVLNLTTATLSYRNNILAAEERMSVILEVNFRRKDGTILWSSRHVPGTTDYKLPDGADPLPVRKQALSKLARDSAEHSLNLMMSDF
ncbi:MAG: LptE family protein [Syntrophaceae bacterium]|nr:LptE family protein [Syntrophaceae bacterium]HOC60394.1 LptE family protein [Smithellaceae bacterium]HQM45777.1 LptE family protein [Smithellaceae bacterium]